jgi:hypothetical protein
MSVYKKFRTLGEPAVFGNLSSRYDQPTYVSFRLVFAQNRDVNYNDAGKALNSTLNYDTMPHPLFADEGSDSTENRETYSSISYLLDSNEFTRAQMLREFIDRFNELQNNFQWYFQSVDGLEDMLAINHSSGQRVLSDKRLTINMMEGIDMRVSYLLSLYKKIAWDETYQRWILPEMMRYFTLRIYISEFRTFHYQNVLSQTRKLNDDDLILSMMDDILPTWIIECEQCEFDLESSKFSFLSNLTTSDVPDQAGVTLSIKVGKIFESQIYKVFRNSYLIDRSLNGYDRMKSEDAVTGAKFDSTSPNQNNNGVKFNNSGRIAQSTISDSPTEADHISGLPYNENANTTNIIKSAYTNKDTWISNAANAGVALAKNYIEQQANKLKTMSIPKLGISVNEVTAALESKNVFTALGMMRKAMTTAANELIDPSEKLSETIIDASFTSLVNSIAKSGATSGKMSDLAQAANMVLNDKGVWDALKDYSLATDMVSSGEENVSKKIQNGDIYKNNIGSDRSGATDLDGGATSILGSLQSESRQSVATTSKLVL